MTILSWDMLRTELFSYHLTLLNISLGSDLLYASWNPPQGLHGPEWKKKKKDFFLFARLPRLINLP